MSYDRDFGLFLEYLWAMYIREAFAMPLAVSTRRRLGAIVAKLVAVLLYESVR